MASAPVNNTPAPPMFVVMAIDVEPPAFIGVTDNDGEADKFAKDYIAKSDTARVAVYAAVRAFAEVRKVDAIWTARR